MPINKITRVCLTHDKVRARNEKMLEDAKNATSRGCCMSACTRCFRQKKVTEKKPNHGTNGDRVIPLLTYTQRAVQWFHRSARPKIY